MEFTLFYRGPLKPTTNNTRHRRKIKHALRKYFHEQLKELLQRTPLKEHRHFLERQPSVAYTGVDDDANGGINMAGDENLMLLR